LRRSLPGLLLVAACAGAGNADGAHVEAGLVDAPRVDATACEVQASKGGAIRVNQVGYRPTDAKHARLIASAGLAGTTRFTVTDAACKTVFDAAIGDDLGPLNAGYPHVYDLDVTALTTPGAYVVHVVSAAVVASAKLVVGDGASLYRPLLANTLAFYEAQRDGADVDGDVLSRKPSHLADESASIYEIPAYTDDALQGGLKRIGMSTIDVSGGWFDAGDYLKFVETTSYTVAVMLLAVRDHASDLDAGGVADFGAEAKRGLIWLSKMYDDDSRTLYFQVGIGDGTGSGSILGDHDVWRLPEADDAMQVHPGDPAYFVRDRPVFRAGPPGSKISPNLAGRLAADFALGAQVYATTDAAFAATCLASAEHVFALADTSGAPLLTTAPDDYYPEAEWRDDLELGAVELALALEGANVSSAGLPETDSGFYLASAATWAGAYIHGPGAGSDSLNLYDDSALAHDELALALAKPGAPSGLAVTRQDLLDQLAAQLAYGSQFASGPFGGFDPNAGDSTPHALGLALTAEMYQSLSGDAKYEALGTRARDSVLGANAWGTSFIVGAGTVFPHCLQHQVANLVGALDGTRPLLLGATVDGPASPSDLQDLGGAPDGARACPSSSHDPFKPFDTKTVAYVDEVASWPSVEPALDYTALTILLFARQ
jgi:endoglucanase